MLAASSGLAIPHLRQKFESVRYLLPHLQVENALGNYSTVSSEILLFPRPAGLFSLSGGESTAINDICPASLK